MFFDISKALLLTLARAVIPFTYCLIEGLRDFTLNSNAY